MKRQVSEYAELFKSLKDGKIVFLFGTGISSALTGKSFGWKRWLSDGIRRLPISESEELQQKIDEASDAGSLIKNAEAIIERTKKVGVYREWMNSTFEKNKICNIELAEILKKFVAVGDVFATTNYDMLLERATGLETLSYDDPSAIFTMLDSRKNDCVIHLHGVYDSLRNKDNIVATEDQYDKILGDEGVQFVQKVLGTRTVIFVGCGQTVDDVNISKFIDFAGRVLRLDREYCFLCKDGENYDLPNNVKPVAYGTEYGDLIKFLSDMADIRLAEFMLRNPVVGRNVYVAEPSNMSGMASYHFMQEQVPFTGRNAEMTRLLDFLSIERKFCWWAVTGQAGSGKSRLALELLKRTGVDWFGFFIGESATVNDAENYTAFKNTLIVVDYVKGNAKKLAAIVDRFMRKYLSSDYMLRVLFIERENDTSAGTWYSELTREWNNDGISAFTTNEFMFDGKEHNFLNLADLRDDDVAEFIGRVCRLNGLPDDPSRDKTLMREYESKFEKLRFRPLFVQMYVEAWIGNGCISPRFDRFEDLLKFILDREQNRWLKLFGGSVKECSALVSLIVKTNCIGMLDLSELNGCDKKRWLSIQNYISENSMPGRQGEENLAAIIAEMCQSDAVGTEYLCPQFPDILKEYMFIYYCTDEERYRLASEFTGVAASAFATFMERCVGDFPFSEEIRTVIKRCCDHNETGQMLAARLNLLNRYYFNSRDEVRMAKKTLEEEYEFWHGLEIDEKTEDSDFVVLCKFVGLDRCASHFGSWATDNVDDMMRVIDEACAVEGGETLNALKIIALDRHIMSLSTSGFSAEAKSLTDKSVEISEGEGWTRLSDFAIMSNYNICLMDCLLDGDLYAAYNVLKVMNDECNEDDIGSVRVFALSCRNLARIAFEHKKPKLIDRAENLLRPYYRKYSGDDCVLSRYLMVELQKVHHDYFCNIESDDRILEEFEKIKAVIPRSINTEEVADVWAACSVFELNFIDKDENRLKERIEQAISVLNAIPYVTEAAQVYMQTTIALHRLYDDKISKSEIDRAYAYMLRFPDSESVRACFFDMLERSVESDNRSDYMPRHVLTRAVKDCRFNPYNRSGIDELDRAYDEFVAIRDVQSSDHPKIGRNDPCPCGSGKKYKKCCLNKKRL